ncbi:hypothetical protein NQ317_004911 [Molorchus minor]|uniref:Uncharacterized protein n=1 Tax=Molorchus minor TaxID=1323400 RepID=A0ABQ9JK94_9CUCU|nr:hypothetical protein NQ317_004911 [Molorchus minor]
MFCAQVSASGSYTSNVEGGSSWQARVSRWIQILAAGSRQARAGVSEYQKSSFLIIVFEEDGPEVETERATVHTGIGLAAQLVCIVHAEPAPQNVTISLVVYFTCRKLKKKRTHLSTMFTLK